MALQALSLSKTKKYIPLSEIEKENATEFTYGVLDSNITAYLADTNTLYYVNLGDTERVETKLNHNKAAIAYVKHGLKSVTNFIDENKKSINIEFEDLIIGNTTYQVVSDSFLRLIPLNIINELASEIRALNELDNDDVKN